MDNLVLDFGNVTEMDSTASDNIVESLKFKQRTNEELRITLHNVTDSFLQTLKHSGLPDHVNVEKINNCTKL